MCKAMVYVQGVTVLASAYSLVAISLDRCLGICRNLRSSHALTRHQALMAISGIWVAAVFVMTPWILVFQIRMEEGVPYCVEIWPAEIYEKYFYIGCNLIFAYCLPFLLIVLANIKIWCKLSDSKWLESPAYVITGARDYHRKTRNCVRKSLTLVTFVFLLSWLPLYSIATRVKLFSNFPIEETEMRILGIVIPLAQLLGSFNSSVNPIIYAYLSRKFRTAVKQACCSCGGV